jgi:hypothetical protein
MSKFLNTSEFIIMAYFEFINIVNHKTTSIRQDFTCYECNQALKGRLFVRGLGDFQDFLKTFFLKS